MPFKMTINESLSKKLDKARASAAMHAAMTETMKALHRYTQRKPTPHKTGNLMRSISYDVQQTGGTYVGQIKINHSAKYWVYQNFGTRKIPAKHFIENATQKVKPEKKLAKEFKERFKQ